MTSPVYYNAKNGEASAIFVTYDDAQAIGSNQMTPGATSWVFRA